MARVSRLWKKLGVTAPLFTVWSEEDYNFPPMNDHDIKAISINRGSANSVTGVQDHTMEVETIVSRPVRTDRPLHCDLTSYGAQLIASKIGAAAADIRPRYFGRIGRQSINDEGGVWGPDNWHTTMYCSKWQSQLENSTRTTNQTDGRTLVSLFNFFMNRTIAGLPYMPTTAVPGVENEYGVVYYDGEPDQAAIAYSDFRQKYIDDPGFYVQNTRKGADQVLTLAYRRSVADNRIKTWLPLTRSQALAPASWDQPNEDRPRNHRTYYRDGGGLKFVTTGPDPDDPAIPIVEHDMSHVRFVANYQPIHLGYLSYAAERSDSGYSLPDVTIDLLKLIASPRVADRRQAVQLLSMEMGDPVFLSGDWYWDLQGVHYASGITEKISPDGWEITLSLNPASVTVGESATYVPPRVWESARFPWNESTEKWDG